MSRTQCTAQRNFLTFPTVSQATLRPRTHESHYPEPRQIRRLDLHNRLDPGFFALLYVPGKLIVHGNAAATASNIAASETLFRAGIACSLICQILFMWVALALYDLLQAVNRRHAALMFGLIAAGLPIVLLNELNSLAALILVRGADFLSIFDQPQRAALAMLRERLTTGLLFGSYLYVCPALHRLYDFSKIGIRSFSGDRNRE